MRELYTKAVVLLAVLLSSTMVHSQCEEITIESLSNPGVYDVATLTEADGLRNGPDYFGATVYYPTNATPPYASIAIVPGFTASPESVEAWAPFYGSHGIVTIIIGTNSIYDFPEARAEALLDALETLREENTRNASPLLGAIDEDKFAVSGWSMGGGGAQRAAVLDNSIKGVVALCPWLPSPDLDHDSAVVIFSGQDDTVAPPGIHANIHYDNTPRNKIKTQIPQNNTHNKRTVITKKYFPCIFDFSKVKNFNILSFNFFNSSNNMCNKEICIFFFFGHSNVWFMQSYYFLFVISVLHL